MNLNINSVSIKIKIICVSLIFMVAGLPLYSGDLESTVQNKLVVTQVLIRSDVSAALMNDVSAVIQKNLQADDYFIVNDKFAPDDMVSFNSYITGRCVPDLAKVIPGGIIILVAVKKGEVKVGEKQHSRYVVEDIIETRYTIYVSTVDLAAVRYDLKFRETVSDTAKLTDEADHIGKKIREFYIAGVRN